MMFPQFIHCLAAVETSIFCFVERAGEVGLTATAGTVTELAGCWTRWERAETTPPTIPTSPVIVTAVFGSEITAPSAGWPVATLAIVPMLTKAEIRAVQLKFIMACYSIEDRQSCAPSISRRKAQGSNIRPQGRRFQGRAMLGPAKLEWE